MLSRQACNQVRQHFEESCTELVQQRSLLIYVKQQIFKELRRVSGSTLEGMSLALERLAAINLELSNAIHKSIKDGSLLAAHGLLRWQLVLWQKSFAIRNSPDFFIRWQKGEQIKESELRVFMDEFELGDRRSDSKSESESKLDIDRDDYENLSCMLHLRYNWLEQMYDLSTLGSCDDYVLHMVDRLVFADIRNTGRFLLVALHHLRSVEGQSPESVSEIESMLENVYDRLDAYREKLQEKESEKGWFRAQD